MPAGALIASQAASVMIPLWGWRSVFVLGGALPLVVAVALIKFLPESVEWRTQQARTAGVPVRQLFTDGRALGTLLLWIPFFMNLLILYFILSWLPALLRQSAMPLAAGVQAVAMFSVGGIIGILTAGRLMIAVGARALLIVQFVLCAVLIATLANVATSLLAMLITTMALGICGQGAQAGTPTRSPPCSIRRPRAQPNRLGARRRPD